MPQDIKSVTRKSPAEIFCKITTCLNDTVAPAGERDNVEVIIDMHWFFIHSKYHKKNFQYKKHIGKWKHYATSDESLYDNVFKLIPLVAEGKLPVVKFTNTGNVFTGEKTIVVYCFPFGPTPKDAESILIDTIGKTFFWGSKIFQVE